MPSREILWKSDDNLSYTYISSPALKSRDGILSLELFIRRDATVAIISKVSLVASAPATFDMMIATYDIH